MNESLTITNELMEDIPVLLAQMERMGVQPRWINTFPRLREGMPTHGNWRGLAWVGRVQSS